MKWWENPKIKKMYVVAQLVTGISDSGQENGWMPEGIFETEQEAIDNCTENYHCVLPIGIGVMLGPELPDGIFWPQLQTKEEAQIKINSLRRKLP